VPTAVPRGLSVPTRVVNHRGGRTWVPVGVGTKRSKKVFGRPMDGDLFCGGLRVAESTGPSLLRRIAVLEVRRLIADLCANVIRSAASSCSTQVRASAGRWGGGSELEVGEGVESLLLGCVSVDGYVPCRE